MVPISPLSFIFPRIRWNPELYVTPETWQPTKNDPSETFTVFGTIMGMKAKRFGAKV